MAQTGASKASERRIGVPEKVPVVLTVNGTQTKLELAPWTTLLDALRERLGLTAPS